METETISYSDDVHRDETGFEVRRFRRGTAGHLSFLEGWCILRDLIKTNADGLDGDQELWIFQFRAQYFF